MNSSPRHIIYHLLYEALVEIRTEGHALQNERIFQLADLFHNIPLRLERMEQGATSPEAILEWLGARAEGKVVAQWLKQRTNSISQANLNQQPDDISAP